MTATEPSASQSLTNRAMLQKDGERTEDAEGGPTMTSRRNGEPLSKRMPEQPGLSLSTTTYKPPAPFKQNNNDSLQRLGVDTPSSGSAAALEDRGHGSAELSLQPAAQEHGHVVAGRNLDAVASKGTGAKKSQNKPQLKLGRSYIN